MIKIDNHEVFGFKSAIRGMRNPLSSWDKSDSYTFAIGDKDLELCKKLIKAGTDHRKFLRMIHVQVDVTAPLYWWKEYDTYKVGTVANSCSTMHTIHKKKFTIDDFSHEHLMQLSLNTLRETIRVLNIYRDNYVKNSYNESYWWQMIQLLPTSYLQKRTLDLNYETLLSMYRSRNKHKLDEWKEFCKWIKSLPYMKDFLEVIDES